MKLNWYNASHPLISVGIIVAAGLAIGILAGVQPLIPCMAIALAAVVVCFLNYFEQTVLALLIVRSSLDIFSAQQVPAMFAVGLDALTILYVTLKLLTGQKVQIDRFWIFFAVWVALQGLWVVLIPLNGFNPLYLSKSIPEWVRLFSWLMVYLLVMQLKDRVHPVKIINALFLSLIAPLTAGLLQILLPAYLLPSFLTLKGTDVTSLEQVSRINGTLGHPNTFATFILLFISLTYWKTKNSEDRKLWLILLGILIFFITTSKALVGLVMTSVLVLGLIAPKLNLSKLIVGLVLIAGVIGLFASTEFGQERLASIANTPLLNPDIDISQAILLNSKDGNSFNWRLAQWTSLLESWRDSPIFGYGLKTSSYLSYIQSSPHNDYIRALVEGGIIGFTTFIAFLGANYWRLTRVFLSATEKPKRDLCLVAIAVLLALNVGMLTENIWSHTTLFYYWVTIMAIVDWDWKPQPEL